MTTTLIIVLSVAVAAALTWVVRRREIAAADRPTRCAHVLDTVFKDGSGNIADTVLLSRLMEYRDECIGDAAYADQARRLMLNIGQPDSARAFIDDAERHHAFASDELKAQRAWVDLAAAHIAWTDGNEARANELLASAVSAANELRAKWPEWSPPYRILEEAGRAAWKSSTTDQSLDYLQLERRVRGRVLSGAFVRDLGDAEAQAYTFVLLLVGMLALCAGVSGLLDMREMTRMSTSLIASATPGYVELKGVLRQRPGSSGVIGPHSHAQGVWYQLERRSGLRGASTSYEQSAETFLMRDASGDAIVEPHGMTVHTRHTTSTSGGRGVGSTRRTIERMLEDGDDVYVLGELVVSISPGGATERRLRVAEDGRQLLVSTFGEEQLAFLARLWIWSGAIAFVLALVVLAWAYHQRFQVIVMPGLLR
ncbi:MAG: hypothetical protein ABJE10_00365 [bacterium]